MSLSCFKCGKVAVSGNPLYPLPQKWKFVHLKCGVKYEAKSAKRNSSIY